MNKHKLLVSVLVLSLLLSLAAGGALAQGPNPPGGKPITAVNAGTGLTGGGTSGVVTLTVASAYQLPQACGNGQVAKWSGTKWVCADDSLTLPFSTTVNGSSDVFAVTNTGTRSGAGLFQNVNPASSSPALKVRHFGSGTGVDIMQDNPAGGPALAVNTNGLGQAGGFVTTNPDNPRPALIALSQGPGPSFMGQNNGSGVGGSFWISNITNSSPAFLGYTYGTGPVGKFYAENPSNHSNALEVTTNGSGWAGYFTATDPSGKGLYVSTAGGQGLQVVGGGKSAVVATTNGARLLYTEESSQVWFTDYGFGRLQNGRAVVAIDPMFAETINLDEPYHVFVQSYGAAELYVTNRTRNGFEVRTRDGDASVEFSYRLVAKRLGFEDQRLEHAAWADDDPNLYPSK